MMKNKIVDMEDKWEKDDDVRALAKAKAIHADPERHKRAVDHAKTMLAENKQRKQRKNQEAEELQHAIDLAESAKK